MSACFPRLIRQDMEGGAPRNGLAVGEVDGRRAG